MSEGDHLRGWIPPDDRLWRHPSESASSGPAPSPRAPAPERAESRDRSAPWLVGGATACVIVVLVAAGLVVATTNRPGSHNGGTTPKMASLTDVPTTEPGVGLMPPEATIEAMVAAVGPSIVALVVTGPTGDRSGTAVVAESGGIVVTATALVAGARSVTAVEANGVRMAATPVGSDPTTGLTVLRIADDLPAALFDFNAPVGGSVAVAMALEPNGRAGAAPGVALYAGSVVASGVALNLDRITSDFATTAVAAPLSSGDIGCPLLDDHGHVSGLLERTGGTGMASASVFLPADLVWSVADQLVSSGSGRPGVDRRDHGERRHGDSPGEIGRRRRGVRGLREPGGGGGPRGRRCGLGGRQLPDLVRCRPQDLAVQPATGVGPHHHLRSRREPDVPNPPGRRAAPRCTEGRRVAVA